MKLDRKKIEKATTAAGLTRYQLLDLLEISECTFYRWLRTDAPRVAVLALAQLLKVEDKDLAARKGGGK